MFHSQLLKHLACKEGVRVSQSGHGGHALRELGGTCAGRPHSSASRWKRAPRASGAASSMRTPLSATRSVGIT